MWSTFDEGILYVLAITILSEVNILVQLAVQLSGKPNLFNFFFCHNHNLHSVQML